MFTYVTTAPVTLSNGGLGEVQKGDVPLRCLVSLVCSEIVYATDSLLIFGT